MTGPGPSHGDAVGAFVSEAFDRLRSDRDDVHASVERDDGVLTRVAGRSYFVCGPLDDLAVAAAQGAVVDLGCGAGRHGVALARSSNPYVGVDESPGCVAVCREQGLEVVCSKADAFLDGVGRRYGTVLLMGNNIGLAGGLSSLDGFIEKLRRVLDPGGRVVATSTVEVLGTSELNLRYREAKASATGYEGNVGMRVRFRNLATEWFTYGYFPPQLLTARFADHGFTCESPTIDGKHYLLIARRR